MSRIVVIGSSNIDLTVHTPRLPSRGETLIGTDMKMSFGGKGANQAVAAFRLGGDVKFITKVGNDSYGDMMRSNLLREGMEADGVITDSDDSSGVAWICVDENGDNSIIVMPGANGSLTIEELKPYLDMVKEADYLLMQLEIPVEVVSYLAMFAHGHGVKVVLNPAPARPLDDALLSRLYAIVPNEKECRLLCGGQAGDEIEQNTAILYSKGVRNIIVTLGDKGSILYNEDGVVEVPAVKVDAVDTVAAGDTYCGALCVALSEGKAFPEAMAFATKASAIAVTRHGAQPSVPYRREIE